MIRTLAFIIFFLFCAYITCFAQKDFYEKKYQGFTLRITTEIIPDSGSVPVIIPVGNVAAYIASEKITDVIQIKAVTDLDNDLKSLKDRIVAVYPLFGSCSYNLNDPSKFKLSIPATWVKSATGLTADGKTEANTFIHANNEFPQYSFHSSIYIRTNKLPVDNQFLFGDGSLGMDLYNGNQIYVRAIGGDLYVKNVTGFNALFTMNLLRFDVFNFYKDGVLVALNNNVRRGYFGGSDPNNFNYIKLGSNGVGQYFSNYEFGVIIFSWGLTDSQIQIVNAAANKFLTTTKRK